MKPASDHDDDLSVFHDYLIDQGETRKASWLHDDITVNEPPLWESQWRIGDGVVGGGVVGGGVSGVGGVVVVGGGVSGVGGGVVVGVGGVGGVVVVGVGGGGGS